jgi:hypothetical protein
MTPPQINEWQYRDQMGEIMPWFTRSFLDVLDCWNLRNLYVLEVGTGWSTKWWLTRGATVDSLDTNATWLEQARQHVEQAGIIANGPAKGLPLSTYVLFILIKTTVDIERVIRNCRYDIIVIDNDESAIDRVDVAKAVIPSCKMGGKVILDNANRPELDPIHKMLQYNVRHSYPQTGHPDWRTDCWDFTTRLRWDDLSYEQAAAKQKILRNQT